MDLRVPVCCVLNRKVSPRHAIPHRTLSLPAKDAFVQYLNSDDTRLPLHPSLCVAPQPPEDYDTYVGEDVWGEGRIESGAGPIEMDGSKADAPPRFDDVVHWVISALKEVGERDGDWTDGVVLCGKWVVADDCSWVVPSRTPTLYSARDVFLAMRSSVKFLRDVSRQTRCGDSAATHVELTLARAIGKNPSNEFRVFVPYRLVRTDNSFCVSRWEGRRYAGICQRSTDVCFPTLMTWDSRTHADNYDHIMRHVEGANLLEQGIEADSSLRASLLRQAHARDPGGVACCTSVLLLSVDVVFESLSLPLYIVSAKARCFSHDNLRDQYCILPLIKECVTSGASDGLNDNTEGGGDEGDNVSVGEILDDPAAFFRLFRDVDNWNRHVELYHNSGVEEDTAGSSGCVDRVAFSQTDRRFIVIASERSDLLLTRESLLKRGLPLEILRPELLRCCDDLPQKCKEELVQRLVLGREPS